MKTRVTKSTLRLASTNQNHEGKILRKKISRSRLINLLNRINFSNGSINVQLKHKKYNHSIIVQAQPQICNNDFLRCLWSEHFDAEKRLKHFRFQFFTFTDGLNQIQVAADLIEINDNGVYLELPEHAYDTACREVKRHDCQGISAQVSQDGWIASGTLVNFTVQSLEVHFLHESSLLKNEIDQEQHVHLVLKKDDGFIFSGSCRILRQNNSKDKKIIILKPLTKSVQRIKAKEFRSNRLVLSPLPSIFFPHPLIRKKIHLSLNDISGLGFSVEEDRDNSVLLPGMMIPEMEIQFMHGFSIQCKAQVLYRIPKNDVIKCGIIILDMSMHDHLKLSSLIHQAKNKHSFISTANIDINALLDFFFETGFIYPEKYKQISIHKDKFKATCKELYNEHPEIIQHIIYQDNGKIYGHISINRIYQKTWLMHHLAAVKSTRHKAGLVVLEHILQHINELHSLPSAKMRYLAGYFRPNNRFSNRLFGLKTVKAINDLNKCSVDEFAYLYFEADDNPEHLSTPWTLCESNSDDLSVLKSWYDNVSGGLAVRAMDIEPDKYAMDRETSKDYLAAGFKRERKLFSLKNNDELMAVLIVNISDFGLNMSDLTNCIQVFILEQKQLRKDIIQFALQELADYYQNEKIPILFYPKSYADQHGFSYEKTYMLGILNLDYIDDYLEFKNSLTSPRKSVAIQQAH